MPCPTLSASMLIAAPAEQVYALIADYRDAHARIIPKPPFVSLEVLAGGSGAGTEIEVGIRLLGKLTRYRARVSEPEPGRVLAETNDNGYVTRFLVEPRGQQAFVTIETTLSGARGLKGQIEQRLFRRLLLPVYVRELELLAELAQAG